MSERTNDEERTEQREQRQERHEMRAVISEKTPIQLGLAAAAYFFSFSLVVAAIWWAATLTNMVSTVLKNQDAQSLVMISMQKDISDLQAWRKVIENSGSPAVANLSAKFTELEKEFEIYRAQTEKQKPVGQ